MFIPKNVSTCFDQTNQQYLYDNSSKLNLAVHVSGYYTMEELEHKIELLKDAKYSMDRDNAGLEDCHE